jgi:FKBP-type peptidyl-prolyl cis-trans isomerase
MNRCRLRVHAFMAVAVALSCGAPLPRETTTKNVRADDRWLDGPRCPAGFHDDAALGIDRVEAGTGRVVGDGVTVGVHYMAELLDGTVLHDTRRDGSPIEIVIGSTPIICGFERALLGMRAGEQRRAVVPWRLAFGEPGRPPDVRPRTDLVFLIDLFVPAEPTDERGGGPVRPPTSRGGGGARGAGGH